jgi:hypothetical protein
MSETALVNRAATLSLAHRLGLALRHNRSQSRIAGKAAAWVATNQA